MDRWCQEPHAPGHEHEPHFVSDISGVVGHIRHAREDGWGRLIHVQRPGEVDQLPPLPIEAFEERIASGFRSSAAPSTFDRDLEGGAQPYW